MNRKITIALLALVSFIAGLLVYFSGSLFFGVLTNSFSNLGRIYPSIIIAPLTVTIVYLLYQNFFSKPIGKKGLLTSSIIVSAFSYSGIQAMMFYKDYFFRSSTTLLITIVTLAFHIVVILAGVSLVVMTLSKKLSFEKTDAKLLNQARPVKKLYMKFVMIPFALSSLYFLGDALVALVDFRMYDSPLYLFMVIYIALSFANLFYFAIADSKVTPKIVFSFLNISTSIVMAFCLYLDFADFLEATEPLLWAEYATSKPIGIILLLIMNVGSAIYQIYSILKANKKQPA